MTGFTIPGSSTCLRLSGLVRWEYRYNQAAPTVVGLRSTSLAQFSRGEFRAQAVTATDFGALNSTILMRADNGGPFNVIEAFIQFAGITAGRAPSFFRFKGHPGFNGTLGQYGANEGNLIAYTGVFGPLSATLSLEANRRRTAALGFTDMPDLVGQLLYRSGPITAQLSAALIDLRSVKKAVSSKLGYAVLGGLTYRFAPTTSASVQVAYAEGASVYTQIAPVNRRLVVPAWGELTGTKRNKSFSVAADIQHAWTGQVTQVFYGSYASTVSAGAAGFNTWQLGTTLAYVPVAGLTLAGEVNYAKTTLKTGIAPVVAGPVRKSDDRWTATLRIQRAF